MSALTDSLKIPEKTLQEIIHSMQNLLFTFTGQLDADMRSEYGLFQDAAPHNLVTPFFMPYLENRAENIDPELVRRLYDHHPKQTLLVELHHLANDSAYRPGGSARKSTIQRAIFAEYLEKRSLDPPSSEESLVSNSLWFHILSASDQIIWPE